MDRRVYGIIASMKNLMIVAGEASGELYGARLVNALKKRLPEIKVFGMGGEKMRNIGVEILADIRDVSVVGIVEVLSHLGSIMRAFKELEKNLKERRPDALILIDFPDFNLRLAEKAKDAGISVIYYISPQVWAWRPKRVKRIARLVDKMLVAFSFEADIYKKEGIDCEFVGHPLLDELTLQHSPLLRGELGGGSPLAGGELKEDVGVKEEWIKKYNLNPEKPVLALLPGSRRREIEVHLPIMLHTLEILKTRLQAIIPVAPGVDFSKVEEMVKGRDVTLLKGNVMEVLSLADAAVITSGTATLQGAISGVPMVIIYKVSPLTYLLAKILVRVKNIGIVNIIAGREIVPEFIQSDTVPEKIAVLIKRILDEPAYSDRMKMDLFEVRERLGSPGASERAAEEIIKFLKRN